MGIDQKDMDDYVEVDEMQVLNPELGRLEHRIKRFYLDELFANSGPDLEETAYWFYTPPEGWNSEPVKYKAAEEAPVTFANPAHEDAAAEGRISIDQLQEGQVITGMVSDVWLYHGCQVDFGAEFDGLVPVTQDQWMDGVRNLLMPGDEVKARVHRVLQPGLYRWPVQLELLEPAEAAAQLSPPDEYISPIDHAWAQEQGMTMEDITDVTGRYYEPSSYILPPEQGEEADELQQAYGIDADDLEVPDFDPMEERVCIDYAQEYSYMAAQKISQMQDKQ